MGGSRSELWAGSIRRRRTRSLCRTLTDFDMNIEAALEAARFTKRTFSGCDVWVENGISPDVVAGLRAQGHIVTVWPRYFQSMGRGNAVEADADSPVHLGATDPRADGEAVPQEVPVDY